MSVLFRKSSTLQSRRRFLQISGLGLSGIATGLFSGCEPATTPQLDLDQIIADLLAQDPMPGMTAALVRGPDLIWSGGFGKADLEHGVGMTPDHIQNIGSISKTVTATAIMQLWENNAFKLDDDVNGFLTFSVRNPRFPDIPITFKQLLTHRSSINDGPAYDESYACGDPAVSLADWIEGYFSPDGAYYDGENNFHVWEPGTVNPPEDPRAYSNVAYGLLGLLVEQITGTPFNTYCKEQIFAPLGMNDTGWMLSEIDVRQHAMTYSEAPESMEASLYLPKAGLDRSSLSAGAPFPHCLYSFYNYPDGLVRTSVNDLSKFLRAYINGGTLNGNRILKPETIQLMLSDQHHERGLCWDTYDEESEAGLLWGHDGGDPGIATFMGFRPSDGVGVVVFYNAGGFSDATREIVDTLLETGANQG